MQTFRSLIGMWPSVAAFSRETGIGYEASKKMADRNNIKHEYWQCILDAAHARRFDLTADDLLRMSRGRRRGKVGRLSNRAAA